MALRAGIGIARPLCRSYSLLARLRNFLFPSKPTNSSPAHLPQKADLKNSAADNVEMEKESTVVSFPIHTPEPRIEKTSNAALKSTITIDESHEGTVLSSAPEPAPLEKTRQTKQKSRTPAPPITFKPSFLSNGALVPKRLRTQYVSSCTFTLSAFRREYEARLQSHANFREQNGYSRSFLKNRLKKVFKKRLVRGRPVFPPPLQTSLVDAGAVLKQLVSKRDQLTPDSDWWKTNILPDAKDKTRPTEGPATQRYSKLVDSLVPDAPELAKASNGIPQLLDHLVTKRKHIETLSVFSTEFITPQNMNAKIQEAIDNPTSFNMPVEEMLKQQYKAAMIFSAISESVDKKTGYSKKTLESLPSNIRMDKNRHTLEGYPFPKASQ